MTKTELKKAIQDEHNAVRDWINRKPGHAFTMYFNTQTGAFGSDYFVDVDSYVVYDSDIITIPYNDIFDAACGDFSAPWERMDAAILDFCISHAAPGVITD